MYGNDTFVTTWDQKTKYLLGRWNKRVKMVESAQGAPLSFEKKAALVNTLENTHQRLKAMTEATNPSSIG